MTTSVALLLVLVGCYGELSEDQRRRAALPCRPFNESDPLPRALVTGGVGFVGHHLITRLVGQGLAGRVLVVDNLWRGSLENALDDAGGELIDLEHDMCVEDLTVPGVADRVVGGADVIFHLADIVAGVDYVFKNQPFVFDRNLEINLAVARRVDINHRVRISWNIRKCPISAASRPIWLVLCETSSLSPHSTLVEEDR